MAGLEEKILERIGREGPITFERFMAMALYEPGLGYYASAKTDIGQAADFYTSTNLHALFGVMVGEQAVEMWKALGRPDSFTLVEQGPGRGLFAKDFLDHIVNAHQELYKALTYCMLELNPFLIERQRTLLSAHSGAIRWCSNMDEINAGEGVLFSNELVDSFPVHLLEFQEDGIREIYVCEKDGRLAFQPGDLSEKEEIGNYFAGIGFSGFTGYRTELNLNAKRWISDASHLFDRGYIITVDYGFNTHDYYSPERSTGTLLCYYRHQTNDEPLLRVGEQDITAHVNFSALAEWGLEAGLRPMGFVSQSSFLLNMEIDRHIARLHAELPEDKYLQAAAQVRSLLMPDGVGESHKILIQSKNAPEHPLKSLSVRNRLKYLL